MYSVVAKKFGKKEITRQVVVTTDSMKTLNILGLSRIDVNLENDDNLKLAFEKTGRHPSNFRTFVAKTKPVGVYFGKAFLKQAPGFLEIFNAGVRACK